MRFNSPRKVIAAVTISYGSSCRKCSQNSLLVLKYVYVSNTKLTMKTDLAVYEKTNINWGAGQIK